MALIQCRECLKEVSSAAATCPHCGVAAPAGLSVLQIERKAAFSGGLLRIELFLDDVPQGSLRPGHSGEFEVSPGQHVIEAEVPGRGAYSTTVNVAAGQTVRAELSISGFNGAPKIKVL